VVELDPAILNLGLGLSMAFGPDWLKPIQSRLAALHPELSPAELDAYESACRAAMDLGHAQVPAHWNAAAGDQAAAFRLFERAVLERHPWISEKNLSHLFSQGCYYAWKDGGMGST
jgi:hypothetical protein